MSRKQAEIVYAVMGILALAVAASLEWGGVRSPDVADAGPVPFILALLAGALAGWVGTFGTGVLGGTLAGFAYALGGGIVRALSPRPGMSVPSILTTIFLMTVLGAVLGALATLPFTYARWQREKKRLRRL